jgi:hypothetical protein
VQKLISCASILFFMMTLLAHQRIAPALSLSGTVKSLANRLENEQIKDGENTGSWPHEAGFTGSILTGMVSAYSYTYNSSYKSAIELSGDYIIRTAQGNFYGDEAYALACLSQAIGDPCSNVWQTSLVDFYAAVKDQVGTEIYTSQFSMVDPSTAVFYLANYVVAAYYIDAEDKEIWRDALVDYLSRVDDNSSLFPVMGLGVSTWALTLTGQLDDTLIDPSGTGASCWSDKKLADLPSLLLSHQVPENELYAGSFYWRFDHDGYGDPVSGYTEDAIFALLGLTSVSRTNPELDLASAIERTSQALVNSVDSTGNLYQHLWLPSQSFYVYAGEMLQALGELVTSKDLDFNEVSDKKMNTNFTDSTAQANGQLMDISTSNESVTE